MLKSLFNWRVLANLIVVIGFLVGLVWLTFRWLEHHTDYGQEIPVPNVMNMSVKDAIKEFEKQGLSYEVDSFKYNPKYKPLQVLDIFPTPGSKVKGARKIILKVNPSTWAKVQVPDVIGVYKGLAFRQLEQVGLKVGDTLYENNIQKDAVIKMIHNGTTLKIGSLLPRFSSVNIVIGSGPMRDIPVPNLVGLTVSEAKAIIENNLFEVGLVEYEDGEDDDAIVYYQDPNLNELRDQGMQIDLWASHKNLAQLEDEISELNQIYRKALVDTTAHVIYEKVATYDPRSANDSLSLPEKKTQEQKKSESLTTEKNTLSVKNQEDAPRQNEEANVEVE